MLIEFNVANFRSFNERQTFSMSKAKGDELALTNTFEAGVIGGFELLHSAAIYGPNAGGKSNLLKALQSMKEIVVSSASDQQRGDKLPVTPFRLNETSRTQPSEFEVSFISEGVRYQYGFAATESRIHEEWLLAFPKGRPQRWFERQWVAEEKRYAWELGGSLSGEKQLWQKSTRDNALFLSTAVNLNSAQLQPVYDWFKTILRMTGVGGWGPSFSASLCKEEKKEVLDFLHAADIGIEDVAVESELFDPGSLPDDMPEVFREHLAKEMKGQEILSIKTFHKSDNGDVVSFNFDEESDGTQRLFSFAGPWLDSLKNGYVLFIDELHDSLHPFLVKYLVGLFHNKEINKKNAQLVFTTHETSILNQDVFRRDQIWFCEKSKENATELYPLTDFSPRKNRENLELAYLSGKYGAIPFIKNI